MSENAFVYFYKLEWNIREWLSKTNTRVKSVCVTPNTYANFSRKGEKQGLSEGSRFFLRQPPSCFPSCPNQCESYLHTEIKTERCKKGKSERWEQRAWKILWFTCLFCCAQYEVVGVPSHLVLTLYTPCSVMLVKHTLLMWVLYW